MAVRRLGRVVRAVLALVVLAALVVGVPIALAKLVGWPLPRHVPKWPDIRRSIQQKDIPGSFVVKAIAAVVWLAWLQMTWAVLWETAVNVPRYGRRERPRATPAVPGSMQQLVARLVASVLMVGVVATPSGAMARTTSHSAMPLRTLTPATALVGVIGNDTAAPSPRDAVVNVGRDGVSTMRGSPTALTTMARDRSSLSSTRWMVAKGDSLWVIAERSLGDGTRYPEIMSLNPFLRSPRDVRPGQELTLPAGAEVPADREVAASTPAAGAATDGDEHAHVAVVSLPSTTHVVTKGESIWRISQERLDEATGAVADEAGADHAPAAQVARYVDQVVDANRDRLVHRDDPGLILPGQELELPAVVAGAPADTSDGTPAADGVGASDGTAADTPARPADADTPARPADADNETELPPPLPPPAAATPAPTPVGADDVFAWLAEQSPRLTDGIRQDGQDHAGQHHDDGAFPIELLGGVGAAGVLGGALAWVVRRRRALRLLQREPGQRLAETDETVTEVARALHAIAREEIVSWVWAAQRALRPLIAAMPNDPMVTAMRVGPEGLEVLFDRPVTSATAPFERAHHRSWYLRPGVSLDELERVAGNVGPLCPFLVPLGDAVDGVILVNLEAIGSLRVDADANAGRADAFMRAIVSFLGSAPWARDADVRYLGGPDELDRFDNVARTGAADVPAIVNQINVLRGDQQHDASTVYARRLSAGTEDWVGTIIVSFDDVDLNDAVDAAVPGGALMVLGQGASTTEHAAVLRLNEDGSAHLDPYGLDLTSIASLPITRAAELVALFDLTTTESPLDERADGAIVDRGAVRAALRALQEPADVEVRVFTQPPIVHVGATSPLSAAATAVVCYLALRGASDPDDVRVGVYGAHGITDEDFRSVVARVRQALGLDSTGAPQLRTLADGRIELSPAVRCDASSFLDLTALSGRAPDGATQGELLATALTLVSERPFARAGRYYRWTGDPATRDAERLEVAIADAAHRAANAALAAGDGPAAERLAAIGLRAGAGNEALARLLAQARMAGGDAAGALAVLDAVGAALRQRDPMAEPHSSTQTLCDELSLLHQTV